LQHAARCSHIAMTHPERCVNPSRKRRTSSRVAERLENVRITVGCSASGAAGSTTYHSVCRSPCQVMIFGDDGPGTSSG
jgi:hypothetical protein